MKKRLEKLTKQKHEDQRVNAPLISSLVLSLLFGVLKRYVFGKPLKRIAEAARKVASGEFSVRISPIRGDGKKDEVEVLIEDFNTMAGELESTEILKNDFISNNTFPICRTIE